MIDEARNVEGDICCKKEIESQEQPAVCRKRLIDYQKQPMIMHELTIPTLPLTFTPPPIPAIGKCWKYYLSS